MWKQKNVRQVQCEMFDFTATAHDNLNKTSGDKP